MWRCLALCHLPSFESIALREHPRYTRPAVAALPFHDIRGQHRMPRAANDTLPAAWADRVSALREDVSLVYELQSHLDRELPRAVKRFGRRRRFIDEFEIRMEGREVQRHVIAEFLKNPIDELAELFLLIIQCRDDQVCDLEPHAGLMSQPAQRFEHGL